MASAVKALDRSDAEREFLRKLAKIATAEIVSSKVWDAASLSIVFLLLSWTLWVQAVNRSTSEHCFVAQRNAIIWGRLLNIQRPKTDIPWGYAYDTVGPADVWLLL